MGRRGPAPKPADIRELEGNPAKRPIVTDRVRATGEPEPPAYLDAYARKVWGRIIGSLPPQLFATADEALLASYCTAASLHRKAAIALRKEGLVVTGASGAPYQNPWISIVNTQAQRLATLGTQLGLSPAARNALVAPEADEPGPESKFKGLVALQGGRRPA